MNIKKTAKVNLVTSFPYADNEAKMLWALVNDMRKAGEPVLCRVSGVGTNLDQRTLTFKSNDDAGNPVFGVGPHTQLQLTLELDIDLLVPVVDPLPPNQPIDG